MATSMNITDVKARLAEVVDRVQGGEDVIILRMGRPVARLTAQVPADGTRRLGFLSKAVQLPDDWDDWPEDEARALGIID
jgi:prevent-host-death family protein